MDYLAYLAYLAYLDHIGSYLPRYSRRDADVPLFSRLSLQIFLLFSFFLLPLLPIDPFNLHFAVPLIHYLKYTACG